MDTPGLFEHIAAQEAEDRTAARKALALARSRCERRYAKFLGNSSAKDAAARLYLIGDAVRDTVKQACADAGYDGWENVYEAVAEHMGWTASVKQARRPKMCPYHREVTDISLQVGDPSAGFNAMSTHAFGPMSCRSGQFEGGCNWRPEMVTQEFWDNKAAEAEERRNLRLQEPEPSAIGDFESPSQDIELDRDAPSEGDPAGETFDSQGPVGEPQMAMAARSKNQAGPDFLAGSRAAEALKTIDVEQGEGPVPKMDKRKWTEETVGKPESQMDGSPHPTVEQDIKQPADYKKDFKEQTDAVTEHQDADKRSNPTDGGGPKTDTFGGGDRSAVSSVHESFGEPQMNSVPNPGGGGQACPSCGAPYSGGQCPNCGFQDVRGPQTPSAVQNDPMWNNTEYRAAVDPDKNPIADYFADEFPDDADVDQAIRDFNS